MNTLIFYYLSTLDNYHIRIIYFYYRVIIESAKAKPVSNGYGKLRVCLR